MAGDAQTGVSIMRLTAGLDSGPVCMAASEPIEPEDTYGSLAPRLSQLGGELLVQTLDESPAFVDQLEQGVTYAEKISPADRLLDPQGRPVTQSASCGRSPTHRRAGRAGRRHAARGAARGAR